MERHSSAEKLVTCLIAPRQDALKGGFEPSFVLLQNLSMSRWAPPVGWVSTLTLWHWALEDVQEVGGARFPTISISRAEISG